MIFTAPRFVVIDDNIDHLRAITSTFESIGTPCLGIRYVPEIDWNPSHFRGVRCLFLDLHLTESTKGSDERRHFALIAALLEQQIDPNGGPFMLVVWTSHEHLSSALREYLEEKIDATKPHARPLAVLSLAKENYINVDSGSLAKPAELRKSIETALVSSPQLAAILTWEADVLVAAGNTLASIVNLVPTEDRTTALFPAALDKLLSRLVRETVGRTNVDVNPRSAIATALAPILSDRVLNQDEDPNTKEVWNRAVTRHGDGALEPASPEEAGAINRMLHIAVSGSETILPTDWGAVVKWPFEWSDAELQRRTGLTIKNMMCNEFRVRSASMEICKPVLVRIGAACDYAQNNVGPITFLFGLVIPEDAERQKDRRAEEIEKVHAQLTASGHTALAEQLKKAVPPDNRVKLRDAIWKSPVLVLPNDTHSSRIYVNVRFPQIHLPQDSSAWSVVCRMREQLLMHLISMASNYVARAGIVQLPVD